MNKKEYIALLNYQQLSPTVKKGLEQLINEHFDNPPLKFEELEVGMVVWDNIKKKFVQIGPFCPIDEYYWIYSFGTDIFEYAVKNEFEENRFYRWEVKE